MTDDLVKRLRAVGGLRHDGATRWYVNQDGPEAAAEIERLRAERAKAVDESQKAFIEAETLRAWLRKIAAIENNDWGGDWEEIDTARAYARAALNPSPPSQPEGSPSEPSPR